MPLAVLAAILMVVAYNMGDWGEIPELLRLTKTDVMVWIVTFALTVFADLTQAVGVGMVCAALLFIKRVADTTTVTAVTDDYVQDGHVHSLQNQTIPPTCRIFRIHGPFLFGATDKLRPVRRRHRHAAADRHPAPAQHDRAGCDRTARVRGARAGARTRRAATCCCAARAISRRELIARADFHRHIGDANICDNVTEALRPRAGDPRPAGAGRPGRAA